MTHEKYTLSNALNYPAGAVGKLEGGDRLVGVGAAGRHTRDHDGAGAASEGVLQQAR